METSLVIAKKEMTPSERDLIKEMTRPTATIEVIVPDTIVFSDWQKNVGATCHGLLRAQRQGEILLPVLGRLLAVAKANPEMWKDQYDKWQDFLEGEIYARYGKEMRSTTYEALAIATRWPELQLKAAEAIPRRSFRILTQAIPKGEVDQKWAKALLEKAQEVSTVELEEFAEQKGYLSNGETSGAFIRIPTTKKVEKMWKKFVTSPEVQAVCGTEKPDKILERMLEECSSWEAEGHAILEEQAEKEAKEAKDAAAD